MSYKSKTDVRYFDPFEVDWEESYILLPQVPLRGTQRLSIVGRFHRPASTYIEYSSRRRYCKRHDLGEVAPYQQSPMPCQTFAKILLFSLFPNTPKNFRATGAQGSLRGGRAPQADEIYSNNY